MRLWTQWKNECLLTYISLKIIFCLRHFKREPGYILGYEGKGVQFFLGGLAICQIHDIDLLPKCSFSTPFTQSLPFQLLKFQLKYTNFKDGRLNEEAITKKGWVLFSDIFWVFFSETGIFYQLFHYHFAKKKSV